MNFSTRATNASHLSIARRATVLVLVVLAALCSGCDWNESTVIVDNDTGFTIDIFINGRYRLTVAPFERRTIHDAPTGFVDLYGEMASLRSRVIWQDDHDRYTAPALTHGRAIDGPPDEVLW